VPININVVDNIIAMKPNGVERNEEQEEKYKAENGLI
jgi:hypothetical protein